MKRRLLFIMRIVILLLCTTVFGFTTNLSVAQQKIRIEHDQQASIDQIFKLIKSNSDYRFIYPKRMFKDTPEIQLKKGEISVLDLLEMSLANSNFTFEVSENNYIIVKKGKAPPVKQQQQRQVNGTVVDESGAPIPGVNILEKGTNNGVSTDFNGNYTIEISGPDAVLVFSYIGYKREEIAVLNNKTVNITLQPDATQLDEVVIVGYGTQTRSRVVSAIDRISNESFEGRPSVNTIQALQGQSPGLVIQQRNSEPGAHVNFNIRGISTLGNNNPLVVIDGIVGGDINSLNLSDIENISILKDAGSAAIYGSRSANGVILITTKKGKKGSSMSIQYNGLTGFNTPHYFTRPVSAYENALLRNEAAYNSNENSAVFTAQELRDIYERGDQEWFADEIVKDALQQNHNLSISGGNKNTTYLFSIGYIDQESNFVGPEKGMKRYNYRLNLTTEFGKVKFASTLSYAKQYIKDHSFYTSILMVDAFRTPLYYNQKDDQGNYLTNDVLREFNPLGVLEQGGFRNYDNDDLFGSISVELEVLKNFKLRTVLGGRLYINSKYERVKRVDFYPGGVYGANRNTNDMMRRNLDLNTQLLGEYTNTFSGNHYLNVLLGASNENHKDRGIGIFKKYTDPDLGTPTSDTEISENSYNSNQSSSKNSLNSVFGRLSYTFSDTYFAEFSFRYDGSSKFRKELRWGFFPSVSLGYNITNESFLENYKNTVGNIKLRATYGILGNQNVGNYQYQTTYFSFQNAYGFNNNGVSGTGYHFANPELRWERAATFNVGTDVDFFNRTLSFSFDYFKKTTSDILIPPAVPGVYGSSLPDYNAGKVENKGWELGATYRHSGRVANHTLKFNLGDSKNKVLEFDGKERLTGVEELQVILREGLPFNSYVGLKRDGYFQNIEEIENSAVPVGLTPVPGDNKYVDLNKDGVIDDNDKFVFGNPFPRMTFGLTYALEISNIDFSFFIQGVGKRTMMIRGEQVEPFHYNYGATMYTHQLDYWTPQNTDARYPRLANNGTQSNTNNFRRGSDMYLFDGAYARLKNIQLGYSIPSRFIEKIGLQKVRIYGSAQNLITLSKVGFVDPELSEFDNNLRSGGANSARAYPALIYYGLGLDITF
ncbi:MAG: SusC/RagA family TonB-linked outer membrane protein [Draconibacterium sp.]|nr:MAG: SusC/RagA family TonB-linked outer membrane protein [Draconibacterium sp.]